MERTFGFRPQRTFDEGMEELVSWVAATKAPVDRSQAIVAELEKQKLLV
jgi:dTDP-D-glucose 4,6-dehydratase